MINIKPAADDDIIFIEDCLKNKSEEFCNQCGYGNRFFTYPVTKEQINHFQKSVHSDSYFFTIFDDDLKIGSVELMKNGSIARFLIADIFRGKGNGTAALNLLSRYVFDELKIQSIKLTVFEFNSSAVRCYLRAGFKEIRRETRDNGWVAIYMEKTNWLDTIKQEIIEITETAAYDYWHPITGYSKPYFNFRLEHIKQVEIEARRLMETHGGDENIVLAAVWLHDRFKPQFEGADHGNKSADWILSNLESKGFPAEKVSAVAYAVRNHQGLDIRGLDTLEAKILWDADKISHVGASFLVSSIYMYMSEKTSKDSPYNETISVERIIPLLKNDYEYLSKGNIETTYYFEESKKLAAEKTKIMKVFIEALVNKF